MSESGAKVAVAHPHGACALRAPSARGGGRRKPCGNEHTHKGESRLPPPFPDKCSLCPRALVKDVALSASRKEKGNAAEKKHQRTAGWAAERERQQLHAFGSTLRSKEQHCNLRTTTLAWGRSRVVVVQALSNRRRHRRWHERASQRRLGRTLSARQANTCMTSPTKRQTRNRLFEVIRCRRNMRGRTSIF